MTELSTFPQPGQVAAGFSAMAFDFGTQRIGVAFGQSLSGSARALQVIPARDGIPNWEILQALVQEWQPDVFVVGLPLNMDGSESELSQRALKFGKRLHGRLHRQLFMMDERLSSVAASEQRGGHRQTAPLDDLAAQIILQDWFAELERRRAAGG